MGKINDKGKGSSRRDFLKSGITFGAGAIAGAGLVSAIANAGGKENKVKVLTGDGKIAEVNASELNMISPGEVQEKNQKQGRIGLPGKKFVMVIDLSRCQNARKCMAACNAAHELQPYQHHINTLQMQDSADSAPYYMPKPCFHCDNPPCVKVCPVDATFKRQDGIVLIDNERCIGCRFCISACPYSARMFQWFEPEMTEEQKNRPYNIELNVPQKRGTVTKCLFSADRLRVGKLPYCVSSCPNGVYYFGDKNEDAVTNGTTGETVLFSELIRNNAGYTYFEDLGTKPQVYYLPPKDRRTPFKPVEDSLGEKI
ncbi:MAG: 4Fe-4S dicluster domain-containing protein [Bacteroidia bacterium]|nr:4Fe-4S dicluster domain-containing protein [Bacteroidia bacterium]